ncbi:MAG: haloacid dehalogenase type II [Gemmatimonadaceae bacterium]
MSTPSYLNRREFVQSVGGLVVSGALASTSARFDTKRQTVPAQKENIEAVLFDAFPVFDFRLVATRAEELFPTRGNDLMTSWRTRQFEYTWLRLVARDYADFWRCTEDALRYTANVMKLDLTPEKRDRLMSAFLELKAWPEATAALMALKGSGIRLGFLSNFTPGMLSACIKSSGLDGVFEQVISTDRIKSFKPDPATYQLGVDALRLSKQRVLFAAFAAWDASGAKHFGYPTFWVNRLDSLPEELGVAATDGAGRTMTDLLAFVNARR